MTKRLIILTRGRLCGMARDGVARLCGELPNRCAGQRPVGLGNQPEDVLGAAEQYASWSDLQSLHSTYGRDAASAGEVRTQAIIDSCFSFFRGYSNTQLRAGAGAAGPAPVSVRCSGRRRAALVPCAACSPAPRSPT